MTDKSVVAMEEAVRESDIFLAILTDGYFASEYCRKEMGWALQFNKKVLTCYPAKCVVGQILNKASRDLELVKAIDSKKIDISDPGLFAVGVDHLRKDASEVYVRAGSSISSFWVTPPCSYNTGKLVENDKVLFGIEPFEIALTLKLP